MMFLSSPADLKSAMDKIQPRRVAVAYLGAGWRNYLPIDSLDEIILSPTLGTNPRALADLLAEAESRGRPRVYFLEPLHAKLYLGDDSCLVGSANLSHNGLGGGLSEAAVLVSDTAALQAMHRYLDTLRDQAVSDPATQKKMLAVLKTRWDRAHWHKTLPNEAGESETPPTLADWEPHQERVHVTWYQRGEWEYNEAVMREAVPEVDWHTLDDTEAMTFLESDDIQVGDWLLCWESRTDGRPWKGRPVSWMQVHRLVSDGATEETQGQYTQVALAGPDDATAPEPFELTSDVQAMVRDQLDSDDYRELWGNADDWSVKAAWPIAQRFLAELKAAYLASRPGEPPGGTGRTDGSLAGRYSV